MTTHNAAPSSAYWTLPHWELRIVSRPFRSVVPLILMDVRIPTLNRFASFAAVLHIKAEPHGGETTVMAWFASLLQQHKDRLYKTAFDNFIGPPFSNTQWLNKLTRYLGDPSYQDTHAMDDPVAKVLSHARTSSIRLLPQRKAHHPIPSSPRLFYIDEASSPSSPFVTCSVTVPPSLPSCCI